MPRSSKTSGRRKPSAPRDDRPAVVDQLRRALREETADGRRSAYSIAEEAGVHRIQIGRFLGGADLRGDSISKLCRALRLELRPYGRATRAA